MADPALIHDNGGACTRPRASGWPWLTSAVCEEYAWKLLLVRRFRWSQACSLGTVNPSRKLRRFESFTCHHVLPCGPAVIGSNRSTTAVREEYVRELPQRVALRQPWSVPTEPRCVSESN
jgi:hypothetical protein